MLERRLKDCNKLVIQYRGQEVQVIESCHGIKSIVYMNIESGPWPCLKFTDAKGEKWTWQPGELGKLVWHGGSCLFSFEDVSDQRM